MGEMGFEESVILFWEECDDWADARLYEVASQGVTLSDNDIDDITGTVENDIKGFIEKGITVHGEVFQPSVLKDLHHLIFELELKKMGIANQQQIHRYRDNGHAGISVVEGKLKPDNAMLVMELNRAHFEKKGGNVDGICEDCICGKK